MKTSPISTPVHFCLVCGKRPFPPGGILALICVDPDDGTGEYYSHNTPAAVGNRAIPWTQEFESR
jgi:hypothetical protein